MVGVWARTIQNWAKTGKVPYLELPSGEFRIPLNGLLASGPSRKREQREQTFAHSTPGARGGGLDRRSPRAYRRQQWRLRRNPASWRPTGS
ncbi:MAG: hypothetical protein JWO02_1040 [Solirubrobacterales bacterium]|nr:hypothetical protein [Solirubrobacterales bacterium]